MIIRLGSGEWFECQIEALPSRCRYNGVGAAHGALLRVTDSRGRAVAEVMLLHCEIAALENALAELRREHEEP